MRDFDVVNYVLAAALKADDFDLEKIAADFELARSKGDPAQKEEVA